MDRNALLSSHYDDGENNAFGDLRHGLQHDGLPVTQRSVMTRSVTTWTVVLTSLSVTRPAPVWGQASITASRSAHLVQVLLLSLITPASSAASSVNQLATPAPKQAVFVDQFNVVGIFNSSRRYKHDIQPMDKASETHVQRSSQ